MEERVPKWKRFVYSTIASEISRVAAFHDEVVQWQPRDHDPGTLLASIDNPERRAAHDAEQLSRSPATSRVVFVNGNLNYDHDIQATLSEIKRGLDRSSRLALVLYNSYMRGLFRFATRIGLRSAPLPDTFVTKTDLLSLLRLSGYELVAERPCVYSPLRCLGLGSIVNRLFPALPGLRRLCIAGVYWVRPVLPSARPSLSIVVPARNEAGNMPGLLERIPTFDGARIEMIFVEGHSTDRTWDAIEELRSEYQGPIEIKAFRQRGKGKADAVKLGLEQATGDLVTILDADLTMPPELLQRFYSAYAQGLADFINGSRLVYPMEQGAMRPLNFLGNVFFAKALSFVLGVRLGDSLCGTKLLSRANYERIRRWQARFGDFDPYGDFELLFGAAELAIGSMDVPIRYRDRTYGTTNILRFRDGMLLLRMTLIGLFRIRTGARVTRPSPRAK